MTALVDMKPGQWVLAFDQPYGPYTREMPEHLEMFASRGGGWDSHHAAEIFIVHLVEAVAPKTYHAAASDARYRRDGHPAGRYYRSHVVAVAASQAEAIAFRDRFFAIGEASDNKVSAEMYRRIEKFADREHGKALNRIHKLLPRFFGSTK